MYPVQYRFIDGAHVFTSAHPDLKGLCAASPDIDLAYADVKVQIETLLRHNLGQDGQANPLWSVRKFLRESNQHPITTYWNWVNA